MVRRLLREEASGRRYAVCSETMIRKREFLALLKDVFGAVSPSMRCDSMAVLAFQEAAEAFVTERFAHMSKSRVNV